MSSWVRGFIAVALGTALVMATPQATWAESLPGVWHLQQDPDPRLSTDPAAVYLAGDSLAFDAWAYAGLDRRIQRQGWRLSGYEIHAGMEVAELAPRLRPVIDAIPQTVVIALGTNDLVFDVSVRDFRSSVRELLRLLGDRRVIWIGLHKPTGMDIADRTRRFNRTIRREVNARPQARFARWSQALARNPSWIREKDTFGIHLSKSGSKGFGSLMIRQLRKLPDLPMPRVTNGGLPAQDQPALLIAEGADRDQDDVDDHSDAE